MVRRRKGDSRVPRMGQVRRADGFRVPDTGSQPPVDLAAMPSQALWPGSLAGNSRDGGPRSPPLSTDDSDARPQRRRDKTQAASPELTARLAGYSLTTAEIVYRMPDAQTLLQTYIWQDYDLAPEFPRLHDFLAFWRRELDGPLHSVRVTHDRLVRPAMFRVASELTLH